LGTIRVLVVDDYEPWCDFVATMLQEKPSLQVIGHVSDGLEAVQRAEHLQPDLILLDIGLPTIDGLEAARRIRDLSSNSKIIFVSQECSDEVVQEAFNAGATGYIVKADAGSELLAAIDAVFWGEKFVGRSFAGHGVTALHAEAFEDRHRRNLVIPPAT
jgi:DNA-binding NarL/FixJ family response regulator